MRTGLMELLDLFERFPDLPWVGMRHRVARPRLYPAHPRRVPPAREALLRIRKLAVEERRRLGRASASRNSLGEIISLVNMILSASRR